MKKNVVVHGQGLSLGRTGGSGRYGSQLYNKLNAKLSDDLEDYNVFFPGFEPDRTTERSSLARRGYHVAGHLASRFLPPIVYDQVSKFRRSVKYLEEGRSNTAQEVVQTDLQWVDLSLPTLLHELSNYVVYRKIGRLSLSPNLLLVVTFLDIQDFFYPEYFSDAELNQRRLLYSYYKDRANYFIAISDFTKQTMVERLDIEPNKIKVIHLATGDMPSVSKPEDVQNWAQSFGRFWIYPAKLWMHKNHEMLLKMLGRRRDECKKAGVKLLLTGSFSDSEYTRLNTWIQENNVSEIVVPLGFVNNFRLLELYRKAEFLIFPSLFEGFGMPVLEAMANRCPVISSNRGSLPEVGGDAAVYFDPESEDEMVSIIDAMLTGKGLSRESMIKKGLINNDRFSWDKTSRSTIEIYNALLSQ